MQSGKEGREVGSGKEGREVGSGKEGREGSGMQQVYLSLVAPLTL